MQIVMPKLGLTMTEGTLARWNKAEGDAVNQGDVLFEFENDKSVMEFESPVDGILTRIMVPAGETVPCGTMVALLETSLAQSNIPGNREMDVSEGDEPTARIEDLPQPQLQPRPTTLPTSRLLSPIVATPAAKRLARELGVDLSTLTGRGPLGRIQFADVEMAARSLSSTTPPPTRQTATPVARRLAAEFGLKLTQIGGSGSGGRVVKEDVLQAAAPHVPAKPSAKSQPLTGVRGVIARRMSESAFTAPHVTLFTEVDATALVEARRQLNAELVEPVGQAQDAAPTRISYNTLLVAIIARLLPDHPHLNACIAGEEIYFYEDVNIALAVDTERGLLAPVIRQADRHDLVTLQRMSDALIDLALSGKISPEELTGGTFTITNLGMFDVDGFTPIINQPQAAILGLGRLVPKPAVAAGSEIVIRHMLTLSLSFDHRLVDGGPAARFLQGIRQLVERPFALLIPRSSDELI